MRILVATDAWHPQVNGVVSTYTRLAGEVEEFGAELRFLTPAHFASVPMPRYPGIRLAFPPPRAIGRIIEDARADYVHIATEGPVGWMTRRHCLATGRSFTTSYHTKFPEYAAALLAIPQALSYALLRRFHARSAGIMVATPSLARDLAARGFERLMPWTRGVDTNLFRPRPDRLFGSDRPVFLYAGRVSKEKGIEDFLAADLPGLKVVVGDGPQLASLKRRFPAAIFTGVKRGEDLARHYASADVFVFPSRTDTFGLVLIEAMATGLPVAAYPVTGPVDLVVDGRTGALDNDLAAAALKAMALERKQIRAHAEQFTWQRAARMFIDNIMAANALAAERRAEDRAQTTPSRSDIMPVARHQGEPAR